MGSFQVSSVASSLKETVPLLFRSVRIRPLAVRLTFPLATFVVLTTMVWHRRGPARIDTWLLHGYVPSPRSSLFHFTRVVTEIASPPMVVVLGLLAAMYIWHRYTSMVWSLAVVGAPALAGVFESSLKAVVSRTRPLTSSLAGESGKGFPSGHASGFAALTLVSALALCALTKRSKLVKISVAIVASLALAVTRVIVGVHYPTDVIAGLVLGFAIADSAATIAGTAVASTVGRVIELAQQRPVNVA